MSHEILARDAKDPKNKQLLPDAGVSFHLSDFFSDTHKIIENPTEDEWS